MIDFTNSTHQRGIVVLGSQEYRKLVDGLFDISVSNNCIEHEAKDINRYIQIVESEESSDYARTRALEDIKFWIKTIQEYAVKNIDTANKLSEIFR